MCICIFIDINTLLTELLFLQIFVVEVVKHLLDAKDSAFRPLVLCALPFCLCAFSSACFLALLRCFIVVLSVSLYKNQPWTQRPCASFAVSGPFSSDPRGNRSSWHAAAFVKQRWRTRRGFLCPGAASFCLSRVNTDGDRTENSCGSALTEWYRGASWKRLWTVAFRALRSYGFR